MLTMGEMISDFVNEHKKVKKMIDKTLLKVNWRLMQSYYNITIIIKEEERKRRLAEVEKKRWEEAKRKELYDLMKVNEYRDR